MKRKIKKQESNKPFLTSILDHKGNHSHWVLKNKFGDIIWEEDIFELEDSFNGHKPDKIKERISKKFGYKIEDIKLFGSRVTGHWRDDSDLDVAILDENRIDEGLFYEKVFTLNCEIRFVEDFDSSVFKIGSI